MQNELRRIGFACFAGGSTTTLLALCLVPSIGFRGVLIAFLIGSLVSYVGYRTSEIIQAYKDTSTSKVWLTGITSDLRTKPFLTIPYILMFALGTIGFAASYPLLGPWSFPVGNLLALGLAHLIHSETIRSYRDYEYDLRELPNNQHYRKKFDRHEPLDWKTAWLLTWYGLRTTGAYLLVICLVALLVVGFMWTMENYPWLMASIVALVGLAAITPRIWEIIRLIHSDARLVCGINGPLGGWIAYFLTREMAYSYTPWSQLACVALGGLLGMALGIAIYQLFKARGWSYPNTI